MALNLNVNEKYVEFAEVLGTSYHRDIKKMDNKERIKNATKKNRCS